MIFKSTYFRGQAVIDVFFDSSAVKSRKGLVFHLDSKYVITRDATDITVNPVMT